MHTKLKVLSADIVKLMGKVRPGSEVIWLGLVAPGRDATTAAMRAATTSSTRMSAGASQRRTRGRFLWWGVQKLRRHVRVSIQANVGLGRLTLNNASGHSGLQLGKTVTHKGDVK